MHTFLEQVQQNKDWRPPVYPPLNSSEWAVAFNAGTKDQKTSLANAWMWRMNEEANSLDAKALMVFVEKHRKMYRAVSPYVNRHMFKDAELDGTALALVKIARKDQLLLPHIEEQMRLVDDLWKQDIETVKATVLKAANYFDAAKGNLIRRSDSYINLLQHTVWDVLEETGLLTDPQYLACALQATIVARIYGVSALTPVHPLAEDWGTIAYYASDNVQVKDPLFCTRLQADVATTDPAVAAQCMALILPQAIGTVGKNNDEAIAAETIFNSTPHFLLDLYQPLKEWIPSLSSHWDTCKGLGYTYLEALESVASLPPALKDGCAALPEQLYSHPTPPAP